MANEAPICPKCGNVMKPALLDGSLNLMAVLILMVSTVQYVLNLIMLMMSKLQKKRIINLSACPDVCLNTCTYQ